MSSLHPHTWLPDGTEVQIDGYAAADAAKPRGVVDAQQAVPPHHSVRVPLLLMDAAPNAAAPSSLHSEQSPPLLSDRKGPVVTSTSMKKIRLADGVEAYADFRIADELARLQREVQSLRGQNAALTATIRGEVRVPAAPMADALTTTRLAARDAMRAEEAQRNDPNTPQGAYRQRLANAWQEGR